MGFRNGYLRRWGFKLTKNEATQLAELSEDVDVQTRAPTNEDKVRISKKKNTETYVMVLFTSHLLSNNDAAGVVWFC